jgi:hypothetical protein
MLTPLSLYSFTILLLFSTQGASFTTELSSHSPPNSLLSFHSNKVCFMFLFLFSLLIALSSKFYPLFLLEMKRMKCMKRKAVVKEVMMKKP